MSPKLTAQERAELIKRVTQDHEPVSKICREFGISRVLFYRLLARYKNEGKEGVLPKRAGRRKKEQITKPSVRQLSSSEKLEMLERVILEKEPVKKVSSEYGVSRTLFYRLKKRYEEAALEEKLRALEPQKAHVEHYFRQTPEKYELAVLSLVAKHPEYGVRNLVANLPEVSGVPIVGHHGVQNILRRHGLSTYEERVAWSEAQVTPVTRVVQKFTSFLTQFISIPIEIRARVVQFAGVAVLSAFLLIVVLGGAGYWFSTFGHVTAQTRVGLLFASTALFVGSIFFLYSMKYYFILTIVLSFSQQAGINGLVNGKNGNGEKKGFLPYLLSLINGNGNGNGNGNHNGNGKRTVGPVGLEPSLEHITLSRKPFISIHIPFYNEKNVAERILAAVTSFDYPNYEVVIVDDSTDETTQIIKDYMGSGIAEEGDGYTLTQAEVKPGTVLKLLHRTNRSGFKGGALANALKVTNPRAEFVVVFDADFVPYPDTLELFLKYFKVQNGMSEDYKESNVACVQGYQWHVLNKSENWITRGVRSEYAGSYIIERSGGEILGALKQIAGSVYMIRRDVLEKVGWGTSITEDFELTLKLYEAGYKVVYTPYIQAPAECVSTIQRLARQRMRWAEGHSHNIKKMFLRLMRSPQMSAMEKIETLYLSPYYLQAFLFIVGTLSWLISETIFPARLPFWTSLWGWSLVLTNLLSLPLVNTVGLFLEESEEKDYLGLLSFVALSYILVPFQAYAAIKGFLEREEGPWFRTPKTGKITDIFTRGRFYRLIAGIFPGVRPAPATLHSEDFSYAGNPYLALASANNQFSSFAIRPMVKRLSWVSKAALSILLVITTTLFYFSRNAQVVYATNLAGPLKLGTGGAGTANATGEAWPAYGNWLQNTTSYAPAITNFAFSNTTANTFGNNYTWFTQLLPNSSTGDDAVIPGGQYQVQIAKRLGPPALNVINYAIQLMLTLADGTSPSQLLGASFSMNNSNTDNTIMLLNLGNLAANTNITSAGQQRLALRIFVVNVTHTTRSNTQFIINNSGLQALLAIPSAIQVPEIPKTVIFVILIGIMPFIPTIMSRRQERRRRENGGKGWGEVFDDLIEALTGRKEALLDELPV